MNQKFITLTGLALTAVLFCTGARAESDGTGKSGYYGVVKGGVNLKADDTLLGRDPSTFDADADYDAGFGAGAAIGYWVRWFRVEAEYMHLESDLDALSIRDDSGLGMAVSDAPFAGDIGAPDGDLSADNLMLNAYFDIPTKSKIRPYIGIGIGAAHVERKAAIGGNTVWDDGEWGVAGQGLAGARFDISKRAWLDVGYRYIISEDIDTVMANGQVYRTDFDSHGIFAGLAISWGAGPADDTEADLRKVEPPAYEDRRRETVAEPEPEPVIPPEPYMVYFAFDEALLTATSRATIAEAVATYRRAQASRIDVVGHADRSGSNSYNDRLSRRRAEAVRDELIDLGVARANISVESRGETDPLVETPDGVREAKNRRVKIFIIE